MTRWLLMGFLATVLSAFGCSSSSSKRPGVGDYEAALYRAHALQIDPQIAKNGRYQLVPGGKLVLELIVVRGETRLAYDKQSHWSAAIELPAGDGGPLEISLDGLPAVARVAGEDVLFLAQRGKGRIKLEKTPAADTVAGTLITGEIDAVFEPADRDLIKLGSFKLSGPFQAALKP